MSKTQVQAGGKNGTGSVLDAVQKYETNLKNTFQTSDRNQDSKSNKTYDQSTAVAKIQPTSFDALSGNLSEGNDVSPEPALPENKPKTVKQLNSDSSSTASSEKNLFTLNEKTKTKLRNIAQELLTTEETYVKILYLLDQVFCKIILDASKRGVIPQHEVNKIFQHLSPIYMFHSVYLLPQLRERLKIWDENSCIGDIIIHAGPFLRMYALYIDNYNNAIETIKTWKERSQEFATVVKAIESLPDCENLPLETHLITPVQRTPRYKILLENYLEELPPKSPLRKETEAALAVVEFAASHSNSYIAKKENNLKLVEIYKKLVQSDFDIDDFSRELIKEGSVIKVAARNRKHHERYLYLFSDSLLYCKDSNAIQKLQGKTHVVSYILKLVGVAASVAENCSEPRFFIQGIEKHNEFLCRTFEERDNWVASITKAVADQIAKKNTFRSASFKSRGTNFPPATSSDGMDNITPLEVPSFQTDFLKDEELGTRAPQWINGQNVTMCMRCSEAFHPIWRRQHHCRACGRVVCGSCSSKVFLLPYQPNYTRKVCDPCFHYLRNEKSSIPESNKQEKADGNSDEIFLLSGYLDFEEKNGIWIRIWCEVPTNSPHVCICYKSKMDMKPYIIVSFIGCKVTALERGEHEHSFQVSTFLGEKHVFAAGESGEKENWMNYIINFNMENNALQTFLD